MARELPLPSRTWKGGRGRAGFSYRGLMLALALVLVVPAIAWSVFGNGGWSSRRGADLMMHTVERGRFVHDITERGEVESSRNVEIVSKVKSGGYGGGGQSGGTTILWIIPEGEEVKPGQKVVELDSSALDVERIQQEIVVHNSAAAVTQAKNTHEAAKIAKQEYLNGTYREESLALDNQIEEATERRDRLQEYWEFSKSMHERGYVTKLQLQADYSALLQAQNQLDLAVLQRKVLEDYKREKQILQLDADIATAQARLAAEEASHNLDVQRLNDINEQIANCTICSESAGQVVYANREGHRGEGDIIIEAGTLVRERQPIIRLPDPKNMQVTAMIGEAKVSLVKEGMQATVQVDAFSDVVLRGVVVEVKKYPAAGRRWGWDVKEYETIVKILDTPTALRAGYTAEVKIRVAELSGVLQVPVQALIEHEGKYYCVVREEGQLKAREVSIGPTNDKFVVIEKGLEEGEQVVLHAAAYREEVGLPKREVKVDPQQEPDEPSEPDERPDLGSGLGRLGGGPGALQRRGGPPNVSQMFQRLDSDGNGQLDQNELSQSPEQLRSLLQAADRNGDGVIDRGELTAAMAGFGPRGGPGGPDAGVGQGPGADSRFGGPRAGRPGARSPGVVP